MGRIRYCRQCNHALSDESRFCEYCGAPVPRPDSAEGKAGELFTPRRGIVTDGQAEREQPERGSNPGARRYEQPEKVKEEIYQEFENRRGEAEYREQTRIADRRGEMMRQNERDRRAEMLRQNERDRRAEMMQQNERDRRAEMLRQNERDRRENYGDRIPDAGNAVHASGAPRVNQGGRPAAVPPSNYRTPSSGMPRGNQRIPERQGIPGEQEEIHRRRFQQESVGKDWEQQWERDFSKQDESRFTPLQYVLLGIIAVLVVVLVAFGIFWVAGRTRSTNDGGRQNGAATEALQPGSGEGVGEGSGEGDGQEADDNITILDGGDVQPLRADNTPQTDATASDNTLQTDATASDNAQQTDAAASGNAPQTDATESNNTSQTDATASGNTPQTDSSASGNTQQSDAPAAGDTPQTGSPESGEPAPADVPVADNPQSAEEGTYLLPESAMRPLSDSDVDGMSVDDMQMAINEIYARHGRIFQTESINSYFSSQPWYHGTWTEEEFDANVAFSEIELQNIDFLNEKIDSQYLGAGNAVQ